MKVSINKNFFLTLLLIYTSTQSSVLSFSYYTTLLFLLIAIYFFLKDGLKLDSLYIKFSILFFLINLYLYFSLPQFDFFLTVYIYIKFLYAYISIKVIGVSFFKNVVRIAYYGCIISFPFFIFQLVNFDLTFNFVGFFQNSIDFLAFRNDTFANNIIFTVNSAAPLRNSGFMWEPKGFSNFIIIATFFRFALNGLKIDQKIIVFVLAIITTFSTAGFLALFLLFTFYYLNKNFKVLITIFPIFLISSLLIFFNSNFLYEKIMFELSLEDEYKTLLYEKTDYKSDTYSLGRTGSFLVDFNDAVKRPIIGYGFTKENRTQSSFVKLIRVNGFSDLFVVYGFVGLILYFYRQHIFLKLLQKNMRYKYSFLILLTLLVIYFASTLTAHPFWMSFIFLSVILQKNKKNLLYE